MKHGCPNKTCKNYQKTHSIYNDGFYFRKSDSRKIRRFQCKLCRKKFSASTNTLEYKQNKRRANFPLFKLLNSGVSQRRAAKILGINKKTVARKLIYLAKKSRLENEKFLETLKNTPVTKIQFDDLITKENTKLKPLSVSIAVNEDNRKILQVIVSQIPAFGNLTTLSQKKYGKRKSNHNENLDIIFRKLKLYLSPSVTIKSDEHKHYPIHIKKYFPHSTHLRFKSERSCIAGQGELKKVKRDPLFIINHTCAMFRANINRLIRKTWCTTKDPKRLQDHLDIFTYYYNQYYLNNK